LQDDSRWRVVTVEVAHTHLTGGETERGSACASPTRAVGRTGKAARVDQTQFSRRLPTALYHDPPILSSSTSHPHATPQSGPSSSSHNAPAPSLPSTSSSASLDFLLSSYSIDDRQAFGSFLSFAGITSVDALIETVANDDWLATLVDHVKVKHAMSVDATQRVVRVLMELRGEAE
jgi:hypothetical protein